MMTTKQSNKIAYIYSRSLILECNKNPTMKGRAIMVHDLIVSYGLLTKVNVMIVQAEEATEDDLKLFHSSDYVEILKKSNENTNKDFEEECLEYGLSYDCPILDNQYHFAKVIAGASITAAKILNSGKAKYAINWCGGWHHAQRSSAEGFCYINDIVLAIQTLTSQFPKILYIDLDIHHGICITIFLRSLKVNLFNFVGNGVQNAFEYSNKILTLSLHKLVPGFYPGSGTLNEIGSLKGKYYSMNVPLKEGISDKNYVKIFDKIFPMVFNSFSPDAMVVQCGADTILGDPLGESNLTLRGIGHCVKRILNCDKPTLFLGGGGYNFPNTSRLWTYLTSLISRCEISNNIPDTSDFYLKYVPTYELHIDSGNQKDHNTREYIQELVDTFQINCKNMITNSL